MPGDKQGHGIGNRIAPARFIAFLVVLVVAVGAAIPLLGWRHGSMAGFDVAALVFLASCIPLLERDAESMRQAAETNDANRFLLLLISGAVLLAVLVTVGSELAEKDQAGISVLLLIVATLALAWTFGNAIYTLHYAHIFYLQGDDGDCGGLDFPGTEEPNYWDFGYFAFCLGMTFQTSDVDITSSRLRRIVTLQCLAAFIFNLGIIAFTINVLGGG